MRLLTRTFAAGLLLLGPTTFAAAVPGYLDFQGRVSVDGIPFTGTGQFKFALVNTADAVVWRSAPDTGLAGGEPGIPVSLEVTKGLYHVALGEGMNPLPPSLFTSFSELRLRIWFSDGLHPISRLSPDQRLASVPYAQRSATAATADFAALAQRAQTADVAGSLAANPQFTGDSHFSGRIGVGTGTPAAAVDILGNLRIQPTVAGGGVTLVGDGVSPAYYLNHGSEVRGVLGLAIAGQVFGSLARPGDLVLSSAANARLLLQNGSGVAGMRLEGNSVYFGYGDFGSTVNILGTATIQSDADVGTWLRINNRAPGGRDWSLAASPLGTLVVVNSSPGGTGHVMTYDWRGRVGIGVEDPDAPLSIRRDSANANFGYCLALCDRTGTPWWKLGADNEGDFSLGAAGLRDYDLTIDRGSGRVGLGVKPYSDTQLRVGGDVSADGGMFAEDGFWVTSDGRRKTRVNRMEDALARVEALRGVTFEWRQEGAARSRPAGRQSGFIAQEVATVLPELVHTNAAGQLTVNYNGVTPVLVEGVRELKRKFETELAGKDARIAALEARLERVEALLAKSAASGE